MISIQDCSYRYRGLRRQIALHGVTEEVGAGITALLGPNGAGKSTLLGLLSTQLRPQTGSLRILGKDLSTRVGVTSARRLLGTLPQAFRLPGAMVVEEAIAYAAWVNDVPDSRCLTAARMSLDDVGLSGLANRRVGSLSGGERQRVGIACALAHSPRVVLLDEPTVGLDPMVRVDVRRRLREISADRVVLVSTHLLEDAALLSNDMLVMDAGRVVFHGPPSALAGQVRARSHRDELASDLELAYAALLSRRP